MINVGNSAFQEKSIIDDSLKAAADVDVAEIKKVWNDSTKGLDDKLRTTNDEGLKKVGDSLKDIDDRVGKPNRVDNRSIIARAKNSVLQFPIYIAQTIRVNEAHIIAKMFERVYTTLVQTVLSQNQYIDEDEANNLVFLKRFHSNIKEAADVLVDEFYNKYFEAIDEIDQIMSDSIFFSQTLTENCTVEFRWTPYKDQNLIMENARLINEPLSGFLYLREADENSNEEKIREAQQKDVAVSEKEFEELAADKANLSQNEIELIRKSPDDIRKEVEQEYGGKSSSTDPDTIDEIVNDKLDKRNELKETLNEKIDDIKKQIKAGEFEGYSFKNGRYVRAEKTNKTTYRPKPEKDKKADPVNSAVDAPKILKDSDIKKINGLLPYTIEATFRIKGKNGSIDRDIRYIIGIKSVLHMIRTQDLAEDLRDIITGNVKSLQKIRYKTGEISFMDYMFNIKGIKADAAKHINYNKRWLNTLKRLGEYKNMHGSLLKKPISAITGGSVPIPNGTLILSQPDVTMLMNQTGIDLSVVSNAKKLADRLFLIAVVIVDSSAGTMRVLFTDSDNDWDVQSLASIDAELSKTDNSQIMRELNRMVNK